MKLARNIGIAVIFLSLLIGVYGVIKSYVPNPSPLPFQGIKKERIGPDYLYPDTKGEVATSDFKELTEKKKCGTYSQCNRKTSSSMKKQVCENYPNSCIGKIEIDHIIPLASGGADSVKNLWPQPEQNYWNGTNYGYHEKDRLEVFLINQMKNGIIEPKEAQQCISKDWVLCYQNYLNSKNSKNIFGAIEEDIIDVIDEEDEVYE